MHGLNRMTGLLLCALACGGAWAQGGEDLDEAFPGLRELGIELIPETGTTLEAVASDWRFLMYLEASRAVRDKQDCLVAQPHRAAEIEAAFATMTGTQNAFIAPQQWQALEHAVLAADQTPSAASGGGWILRCATVMQAWPNFDSRIRQLRDLQRESDAALRAAPRDPS